MFRQFIVLLGIFLPIVRHQREYGVLFSFIGQLYNFSLGSLIQLVRKRRYYEKWLYVMDDDVPFVFTVYSHSNIFMHEMASFHSTLTI